MGIEIGFDFDAKGMLKALSRETGRDFTQISGSSETTCEFSSALMPLSEARAIEKFLRRIPKEDFFNTFFDVRIEELKPDGPPASYAQRVKEGAAQPRGWLIFTMPASTTIDLRDLLAQFKFDLRDYKEQQAAARG